MKIYTFRDGKRKLGQISSLQIKTKTFAELQAFGATKAEYDKFVKDGVIVKSTINKVKLDNNHAKQKPDKTK
ncbi:MAG: hypothetical protein IMY67_01850 [Bacteroidetes bacterium]|nr:hypothetical protein [Bacteroidota bacterium]